MIALIIAVVCIGAAVFAVLPGGLGWGQELVLFIKGLLPFLGFFIGLLAVIIGIADIRDKAKSRKEANDNPEDQ